MTDQFVALDIEATAMDPARGEIVEVALVVFDEQGERERFSSLVRPRARLSLDIATLTGIDPAELGAAPAWPEVAPTVRRLVAGRGIVGQSVAYDLGMVEAAGVLLPNRVYDTYQLATLLLHDLPAYTLGGIAVALGETPEPGHRALADALTTSRVFRRLLERIDAFDPATLELLAATTRTGGMAEADLFARAAARRPTGPLFAVGDGASGPHEMAFLTPRERPESLRLTGAKGGIEPTRVAAAFAPDGPLSRTVDGYERRPQQEQMSLAVTRTLGRDERLLVEAGTGTGKSLAYLLPAALHAIAKGETVVVSTNTLALQDQLYRKDLPDLRDALGGGEAASPFAAAVVKGRSNYLCLRQWFAWLRQPLLDPAEARLKAKILAWLGQTETGDRAELRLAPDEEFAWRHVAEEEGRCVASRCVFQQRNQCFLYRARRRAEAAHLVIVNHALLLSDVMAGSRILPEYEHLVVDEAHHLEDQATNQFGYAVAERDLEEFAGSVLRRDGAVLGGSLATIAAFLGRAAGDDA
ncbi:MAG: DEAD/DEAH box helicase family protein, partial [Chloroflexia bacterium]|nr:DEAD/DEAH box helicase family protein [Chloroflexia bacterium]